jgi:hypothetical protein
MYEWRLAGACGACLPCALVCSSSACVCFVCAFRWRVRDRRIRALGVVCRPALVCLNAWAPYTYTRSFVLVLLGQCGNQVGTQLLGTLAAQAAAPGVNDAYAASVVSRFFRPGSASGRWTKRSLAAAVDNARRAARPPTAAPAAPAELTPTKHSRSSAGVGAGTGAGPGAGSDAGGGAVVAHPSRAAEPSAAALLAAHREAELDRVLALARRARSVSAGRGVTSRSQQPAGEPGGGASGVAAAGVPRAPPQVGAACGIGATTEAAPRRSRADGTAAAGTAPRPPQCGGGRRAPSAGPSSSAGRTRIVGGVLCRVPTKPAPAAPSASGRHRDGTRSAASSVGAASAGSVLSRGRPTGRPVAAPGTACGAIPRPVGPGGASHRTDATPAVPPVVGGAGGGGAGSSLPAPPAPSPPGGRASPRGAVASARPPAAPARRATARSDSSASDDGEGKEVEAPPCPQPLPRMDPFVARAVLVDMEPKVRRTGCRESARACAHAPLLCVSAGWVRRGRAWQVVPGVFASTGFGYRAERGFPAPCASLHPGDSRVHGGGRGAAQLAL